MLRQADVLLVHFMQRLFRSLNKSDFAYITLKSHLWRHFDWKAESGVWMHTTCTLIPPCSVQQRTKWPAEESQACGEKNRCNTPKRKKMNIWLFSSPQSSCFISSVSTWVNTRGVMPREEFTEWSIKIRHRFKEMYSMWNASVIESTVQVVQIKVDTGAEKKLILQ